MRIFAVPAAIILACCLYMPLPRARGALENLLARAYAYVLRLFTRRTGQTDDAPALFTYLLLLGGALALLCAVHPLISMVFMAPLFTGLAVLPGCAQVKDELDSGKYARDIPTYERIVRDTCVSLSPAFVQGVVTPMLLCALGMPLHMGASLGYVYAALCALSGSLPTAACAASALQRIGGRVFVVFMVLCAGAAGRNPLRTRGKYPHDRLMNILGIAGDGTDTHAPMAGDIPQGIFLCGFSSFMLCLTLCIVGFVLCR
ncbi:MAG: hypothetical protein IJB85_07655 [Clostridia bacterium]|nr:hypothetical protein [Clostridia bacterium]